MTKKTNTKSLFQKHIEISPEAHHLSVALSFAGIHTDIPSADLILQVFRKLEIMKGGFDLETGCKIRVEIENKYSEIESKASRRIEALKERRRKRVEKEKKHKHKTKTK